jgi:hypothetical protein
LIVGGLAEGNEEHCRAADGYLCFAPGAALVIAGVGAVGIWVVGREHGAAIEHGR